jgi:hypothetical protein
MTRWPAMLGAIFAGAAALFVVNALPALDGILLALVSLIPLVTRRTILLQPAPSRTG